MPSRATLIFTVAVLRFLAGLASRVSSAPVGQAQSYWTPWITMSAEQFGTNIRAAVSMALPKVVRAMAIPITLPRTMLKPYVPVPAALLPGEVVYAAAFAAPFTLPETYGKDLNFVEPPR